MLQRAGIRDLRYSLPWHRIEATCGIFDWSWIDGPIRMMKEQGLRPIVDPLHHTSFPPWLTDGFLHPNFPFLYERFLDRVSDRYPHLDRYTVFNEPLPTTLFCSFTGMWYPHLASDRDFVAMTLQVAQAIGRSCRMLRKKNTDIEFVHVDTAEHHQALDAASSAWVDFVNARRFLITDLVLGRVDPEHELWQYLTGNGADLTALRNLCEEPGFIDILGLDYYIHSEMDWKWSEEQARSNPVAVVQHPKAFTSIAQQYIHRYRLPVMLSETNIRGTVEERLSWLKFMESQYEGLVAAGHDVRGFCWYPSIDSTDWANACTRLTGITDPQGVWSLNPANKMRVETELSEVYGALARGEMDTRDIPAYPFGPELQRRLQGYSPWMRDWDWMEEQTA